jgi:hypothetical protein
MPLLEKCLSLSCEDFLLRPVWELPAWARLMSMCAVGRLITPTSALDYLRQVVLDEIPKPNLGVLSRHAGTCKPCIKPCFYEQGPPALRVDPISITVFPRGCDLATLVGSLLCCVHWRDCRYSPLKRDGWVTLFSVFIKFLFPSLFRPHLCFCSFSFAIIYPNSSRLPTFSISSIRLYHYGSVSSSFINMPYFVASFLSLYFCVNIIHLSLLHHYSSSSSLSFLFSTMALTLHHYPSSSTLWLLFFVIILHHPFHFLSYPSSLSFLFIIVFIYYHYGSYSLSLSFIFPFIFHLVHHHLYHHIFFLYFPVKTSICYPLES